jgi:hypothetical protein
MADDEIKIIRRIRHEISAECGHDVDRVVAYYRRVEEELKRSGRFRFAARVASAEQVCSTGAAVARGCDERRLADC